MSRGPRLGYGAKLAAGHVLLVLAVGAVVMLLIDRTLGEDLTGELDTRLESQAQGAAAWTAEGRHPDRLAARLGGIVGAHVTIVDRTGHVLGDSDAAAMLGADVSHDAEIAAALTGKTGRATRVSAGGIEMRYVAVSTDPGIVLRLGASLGTIRGTVHQVRVRLAVASALGVALAVLLSSFASRLAARPLGAMRDAAQRIADGDYRIVLAGESPDEFGELERSLSVLAARLQADRERIERLEATRRDFVANVSHELRTPTTAIQGYAETLLGAAVTPETERQFLTTMHRQAVRMSALVSDLLQLSAMEARLPEDSPRGPVRVADVAREAAATVRESRSPAPRIELDAPDDLVVLGNAAAVEQILENLIDNAVRHAGSDVHVVGRASGGRVSVSVSDDGPGIAPAHLARVFERFYRIDPARTRTAGGTGLGLAIVKHLAEGMGGSVRVESEVGKGSRFTVELVEAGRGESSA